MKVEFLLVSLRQTINGELIGVIYEGLCNFVISSFVTLIPRTRGNTIE